MLNNFLEIVQRGYEGEAVDKETWDLDYVAINTADIVAKYGLTFDANKIVEQDETTLKKFYDAGRELLIKTGVYNMSTGKIIAFSEEEIDYAAKQQKKALTMGYGKDAFTLYARKAEDTRKPGVFGGNPGCPTPERIFKATLKSWAQEKSIDMLTCGSLIDVDGYEIRHSEPSELIAVRRELMYLKQAAKEVGREGMGMLAAESSVSEIGDLAAISFIYNTDSHLVALNNELITNRDNLVRAANSVNNDVRNASLACVMVEGLAGGPAGAAVCMIASMLAANIVCLADYHLCHPIHLRYIATSTRECMWLQSVVCQAFALCAPNIIVCDIYPKSGALTEELLLEVAANAIAITVSGGHLEGVGACDGLKPHGSGVEARLMGEVGYAVSSSELTRSKANEIILKLLEKYEWVFEKGNEGSSFDNVYDMVTVQPVKEWQAMYEKIVLYLKELGICLK